jgi:hypothetical protein
MDKEKVFILMALQAWETYIKRADEFFHGLPEPQFGKEISPGRNTGTYLLGHLIAVHDRILPVLGLGETLFPALEEPFLNKPDKSGLSFPPVPELIRCWDAVNRKLAEGFRTMPQEDWFKRHASVSAEDFAKEPHRNKLNLVMNRTSHLAYHLGQLALLKEKKG